MDKPLVLGLACCLSYSNLLSSFTREVASRAAYPNVAKLSPLHVTKKTIAAPAPPGTLLITRGFFSLDYSLMKGGVEANIPLCVSWARLVHVCLWRSRGAAGHSVPLFPAEQLENNLFLLPNPSGKRLHILNPRCCGTETSAWGRSRSSARGHCCCWGPLALKTKRIKDFPGQPEPGEWHKRWRCQIPAALGVKAGRQLAWAHHRVPLPPRAGSCCWSQPSGAFTGPGTAGAVGVELGPRFIDCLIAWSSAV